jgi:hypothetical protein
MAQDNHKPKTATILSVEKKTSESKSLRLKRFILVGAVAGLIITVGVGIWHQYFLEKPSGEPQFAVEIRCDVLNAVVVVRSPDHSDTLIACEGSRDAIVFLASQGLDVPRDIVAIELLVRLPAVVSATATGCYLESERRALVLVYSQFRKFKTWFGIPIDRSLYRSLVSHEVAHFVADYNFKISKPTIQAKEYIAYVTQFSTMEPALRERVLSQFPIEDFEGDWQMGTTIYMFDCMYFGVRAYRHFLKPANGRDYLHAILNGKALVE